MQLAVFWLGEASLEPRLAWASLGARPLALFGALCWSGFALWPAAARTTLETEARKAMMRCVSLRAPLLPFDALKNTFANGQSAERVVRSQLQADFSPAEGSREGEGRTGRVLMQK